MCVVVREMRKMRLRLDFFVGDFDLFGVGKRVDFLACPVSSPLSPLLWFEPVVYRQKRDRLISELVTHLRKQCLCVALLSHIALQFGWRVLCMSNW